ncbi:MAG: transcriptional initiation protein Tat [Planctomycetia bacterium]|nr:transcriptional initiation protein Tat [Planctomycetia bacterium]
MTATHQNITTTPMGRRKLLGWLAGGSIAGAAMVALPRVAQAADTMGAPSLEPRGAGSLEELTAKLAAAPRHRDFATVPMILTRPNQWDREALDAILHYRAKPKQVWDNTDITSPWLNLMRNSLNAQIWSFKHPDFLAVSATHGTCHLALYDSYIWDKYNLPGMIGGKFKHNVFLDIPKAMRGKTAADYNDPTGLFSPESNCIPLLMQRGVVFLACHNAIWEFSGGLMAKGHNPDHLSHEKLAAELTNHLIPGAVLTPGIVATIPELELAGYNYIK